VRTSIDNIHHWNWQKLLAEISSNMWYKEPNSCNAFAATRETPKLAPKLDLFEAPSGKQSLFGQVGILFKTELPTQLSAANGINIFTMHSKLLSPGSFSTNKYIAVPS
jgi:hypothetical protein